MKIDTVFMDRDGVINRDSEGFIKSVAEFTFYPWSLSAIARLTRAGKSIFIITNQSGVNRGILTLGTLREIHAHLSASVHKNRGRIRDIFYCPHHPDENCGCRKPKPGMILAAKKKYGLDLSRSVMVGDRHTDIACGRNAGCGKTILISDDSDLGIDPAPGLIFPNLEKAVDWILSLDDA